MMTFVSHVSLLVLMWYPSGVDLQENVFGIVTSTVVIECSLPVTEPFWQGPPAFTIYSNADASAIINPALWNKDRLSVNSNGDLVISASMANDSGEFKCGYSSQTDILFDVKIGCSLLSVPDFGTVNSTFGYPGETAYFSCNQTYTLKGEEILTCLANGSWTDIEPKCGTTTTSTSTTTNTSTTPTTTTTTTTTPFPSPYTTTSQPSSSTTTSNPNPTKTSASPSTSTTSTSVNPETSTAATTSTAAASTTATTVPSPTISSTPEGDSNKSLITLIIVVSIIGGILILAIILMIFLLVHWKNCISQKGHQRHNTHKSYYSVQNRRPHRRYKHTKSQQRSERSFQPHHVLDGYSFYRGGIKNPVFEDTIDSPSVVYYRDNAPDYI